MLRLALSRGVRVGSLRAGPAAIYRVFSKEGKGFVGGQGPWAERIMIFLGYHFVGLLVWLFSRPRIVGLEKVPSGKGVLFLSNHISALDVLVVPWCIYSKFPQELLRQAGKEELFEIPVLGWIISKWRGFPIKRGGADRNSIRAIEAYIREGKVVLYPEGTRSLDGTLGKGNRMVGRIIRQTKPVVIPVAVKGTDKIIPLGKTLPRWGGPLEVIFGEPVELDEEYAIENTKESSARVIDKVMASIADLLQGLGSSAPYAQEVKT